MGSYALAASLIAITGLAVGAGQTAPVRTDWPMYRADSGLTGTSPLKGGFGAAPAVAWTADLGGPLVPLEQARVDDFDGDGKPEVVRLLPSALVCQDLHGAKRWEVGNLDTPTIVDIRDWTGDGSRGILLSRKTESGLEYLMISGRTGAVASLMPMRDAFGGGWRAGHLVPGVKGQQLSYWWSGNTPNTAFGGPEAYGHGWLWSFEEGPDKPRTRFQAEPGGVIYAPLHLYADMDGDGRTEMVMISHEHAWLYDLETGAAKADFQWGPQIRSYWATCAAVALKPGELPTLLTINPHQPGVKAVKQDGKSGSILWKAVVGKVEDQYQAHVKIGPGAPDPFVDLDGDGQIEIMATVTNEHDDRLPHLVIFGADRGDRLLDEPNLTVLTVDDLDGDGKPELLIRDGEALRIANFDGKRLVERWSVKDAEAVAHASLLLQPAPPEGNLNRCGPGNAIVYNRPLWRVAPGAPEFLLWLDGKVQACRLAPGETLAVLHAVTDHEALRPTPGWSALAEKPVWDGHALTVQESGSRRATYTLPEQRSYLAWPPIVGDLAGQRRIVVVDGSGDLLSLSPAGDDRKVLLAKTVVSGSGPSIRDVDGDGANEIVTLANDAEGRNCLLVLDAAGRVKQRTAAPATCYAACLGPTGSLGPGRGCWAIVRYQRDLAETAWIIVAYDLAAGKELWTRESYGLWGPQRVQFLTFLPTSVYDYDGDGSDDFVFCSGSFYGVINVRENRELVPIRDHCAAVPGHWSNYGNISLLPLEPGGKPRLFFSKEYALVLVTDLDGDPVWHYGLTRDTTSASMAGLGDLNGDVKVEPVVAQPDGLLRCFDATGLDAKCPNCPPDKPLGELNHAANQRWTFRLPPPVSDFTAADLDGDGCAELLCGAGDGKLYALKETAGACTVLWSLDLGRCVGSPVVADVDSDGHPEILVTTQDGRLHCLRSTGRRNGPS
jgi:hypothetical protein